MKITIIIFSSYLTVTVVTYAINHVTHFLDRIFPNNIVFKVLGSICQFAYFLCIIYEPKNVKVIKKLIYVEMKKGCYKI